MSAEAVVRTISHKADASVVGCNIHPMEWTAASRLVERFHRVPPARDTQAYIARLLEICMIEQISHVIPLTDPEVDALSANRDRFDDIGVTLCISPPKAIRTARDKLAIYRHFSDHPRIRPIPTADLADTSHPGFHFPLIAKQRYGRSSEEQVDIPDASALQYWRGRLSEKEYVVQPLYIGDVFVTDVVRQPGGYRSVAMTRRELLRTRNGAGMTVRMQPDHACDALALETAELIDLEGCVNIEFLVVDGTPLLMDVNPRFSAGVSFSMRSGYDMISNHLRCFNGEYIEPCPRPPETVYTRTLVEHSLTGLDHAASRP